MAFPKKSSSVWHNQKWLKSQGLKYVKADREIPKEWPKDYELKDADGKVYMRLIRGKKPEIIADASPSVKDELDRIKEAIPRGPVSRGGIPQTREPLPDFRTITAQPVAAQVPASTVANKVFFQTIARIEKMAAKPPPESAPDDSDATCQGLADTFAAAYPNATISPKISFWFQVVTWQAGFVIWIIKEKGKALVEWFKKRKEKKNIEEEKKLTPTV